MTMREDRLVRRRTRRLAGITAALVAATLAAQAPVGPAAAAEWQPPKPEQVSGVPRHDAVYRSRPAWTAADRELKKTPAVSWPAGGTAIVTPTVSRARAGSMPVWAGAGSVGKVAVSIRDRASTSRAGVAGLILDVSRADGVRAAGSAPVSVDYSGFAHAYGGDWASRLRLVDMATGKPLASRNDTAGSTVTADVPMAASGAATTLMLAAGPSGDNGTYAATSLTQAGTWQVSPQTGGFSWSQNLRMPPGLNGPSPSLSLGYSSLSVDGRTAGTNTQGSWVGDGWDMWSGYIERQYMSCADDKDESAGNTPSFTGDLCWRKPEGNATLSLNGQGTELVKSAGNTWKGVTDDGSKIELLKNTSFGNGDDDGEYWKVTTIDGTQYFFGRNHGIGGATAATATDSTWTVPVYGNHSGEPGYTAGDFAASRRTQGWRWNLDYVVDTHGNTMTFFYGKEGGAYGREGDPAKRTTYDRGGYLTRIEYGNRADAASTVKAAAQVLFDTVDRCVSNCFSGSTPVQASWPDTPWDQNCAAAPCTGVHVPTFWTQKRLSAITTQVLSGSSYTDVDRWTLRHTYLQAGGNEGSPIFLAGITHTGKVLTAGASSTVTDPEIVFDAGADPLPNRVDGPTDGRSSLFRSRIQAITTESGGQIVPTYSAIECRRTALPSPSSNTSRCFPQWYGAPGEQPTLDWFHSYRVDRVDIYDNTDNASHEQRNYDYDTPAWHYDDSELVPEKKRTWGQFRGYSKVSVRSGLESGTQSQTDYLYFRGMDGDKQTSGVRDVSITDSQNESVKDDDAYAGTLREETTRLGAGGTWIVGTITTPGKIGPTATSGPLKSWMTNTVSTRSRTKLSTGATRWTKTVSSYNADNLVTAEDDLGDETTAADDRCTRTWYARNADLWMLGAIKKTETVGVNCSTTATLPGDMLSSSRTTYDLATNNWDTDLPVKGDAAKVEQITGWNGSTPIWGTISRATFDVFGRPKDVYDALSRKSHTEYVPALTGPVTQTATTDPLEHTVTTTVTPAWGSPTKIVDANGRVTEQAYDASGRLTGVWLPGRSKASLPKLPNISYEYRLRNTVQTAVITKALLPNGSNVYSTTATLYDGQLRTRQTQAQAPGGGRVIADTVYDSRGQVDWSSTPYYDTLNNPVNPDKLAGGPGDPPAPSTTLNIYDGAGRNTAAIFKVGTQEKWRTTTAYNGERVDVTPPRGGTATGAVTDARGQRVELRQYKSRDDAGSTDPAKYDKTLYGYTTRGELASVVDPAGNRWKFTYDQLGRQVQAEDPDKGITNSTYDAAGQLTSTTGALQTSLHYKYDDAGRKLTERLGSATGALQAEWVYDGLTNGIGELTKSIRYDNGQQYTTETSAIDAAGRVTGTKVTVPASEGWCTAGTGTTCTFTDTYAYRSNNQRASTTLPAAGDLPAETLLHGYNDVGAEAGLLSSSQIYIQDVVYDKLGRRTQQVLGAEPRRVWLNWTYDDNTGRLISSKSAPELKNDIFSYAYEYDHAGQLTRIADTPNGGGTDTQCYEHDYLQRLTEAWTPSNNDCTTSRSTTALGGSAPYWHSYEYAGTPGLAGNRTKETWHATTGDTIRDYTYPAQGGGAGSKPHAVTQVNTTGAITRTENYQYNAEGNLTCRPNGTQTNTCPGASSQELTWNAQGRLAANTASNIRYIYDATGNKLIRRDSTGSTLYLPDGTELRKTSSALTATRYYAGVAIRTAAGINWLAADHHATAETTVNGSNLAIARRRTLPFGNERGTTAGAWPSFMDKGFVGGTKEPDGLTHLGAREYDPGLGKFISVDPIQDLNDPQQWNAYAYANNSPASLSDPSGLIAKDYADPARPAPVSSPTDDNDNGGGSGDGDNDGGSGSSAEPSSDSGSTPLPKKKKKPIARFLETFGADAKGTVTSTWEMAKLGPYCALIEGDCTEELATIKGSLEFSWHAAKCSPLFGCGELLADLGCQDGLTAECAGHATFLAVSIATTKYGPKVVRGAAARTGESTIAAAAAQRSTVAARVVQSLKAGCSFSAGTLVLLADGSTKKISEIEVGDVVLATDPAMDDESPKPVTQTHLTYDIDVVALTVETADGKETIQTTSKHRFWSETEKQWIGAGNLRQGDYLLVPGQNHAKVVSVRALPSPEWMYDLTVRDIHTYYVLAGATPVLVHNCGGIVYRALAKGEDPSVGLFARDPAAVDVSPLSHVAGKKSTPWISTTKSRSVAFDKYDQGNGVVAIDTRMAMSVKDISDGPFPSSRRHSSYARRDQEVLIFQNVPPEAIVGYWPGK